MTGACVPPQAGAGKDQTSWTDFLESPPSAEIQWGIEPEGSPELGSPELGNPQLGSCRVHESSAPRLQEEEGHKSVSLPGFSLYDGAAKRVFCVFSSLKNTIRYPPSQSKGRRRKRPDQLDRFFENPSFDGDSKVDSGDPRASSPLGRNRGLF